MSTHTNGWYPLLVPSEVWGSCSEVQITLRQGFKQPGRPLVRLPSRLFYISDHSSGLRFLVDTGAEVSVIPPSRTERIIHRQENLSLQAVNNSAIATYGTRSLTLDLSLRHTFRWLFIIVDVRQPILSADFICNFRLLVDVRHKRLADTVTQLKVKGIASHTPSPSPSLRPSQPENDFSALLSEFLAVTQACSSECPVKHDVTHHWSTRCSTHSPTGSRTTSNRSSRLCAHSSSFVEQPVITTPHGPQEDSWGLVTLW